MTRDYWICSNCGEILDRDIDPPANRELSLCIYCEDERYQTEIKNEPNLNENPSM